MRGKERAVQEMPTAIVAPADEHAEEEVLREALEGDALRPTGGAPASNDDTLLPQTTCKLVMTPAHDALSRSRFALYRLLMTPPQGVVSPKAYFAASNELVVLTLIVCWIVTVCYDRSQVWDHPARVYVGHFNPCFGWDYAPASYIAVFAMSYDVHLAWTYASLEAMRTKLRDDDGKTSKAERFSLVTTYLHGLASMGWMLLWLVGPPDGQWAAHLAIFSTAVAFRYLCQLGNYVECRWGKAWESGHVKRSHTVYIVSYGLVSLCLPILYFIDVIMYEAQGRTGVDPPIPLAIIQTLDVVWMVLVALSTRFSVPEPPVVVKWSVLEFDDVVDADDFTPAQIAQLRKLGFEAIE